MIVNSLEMSSYKQTIDIYGNRKIKKIIAIEIDKGKHSFIKVANIDTGKIHYVNTT